MKASRVYLVHIRDCIRRIEAPHGFFQYAIGYCLIYLLYEDCDVEC